MKLQLLRLIRGIHNRSGYNLQEAVTLVCSHKQST